MDDLLCLEAGLKLVLLEKFHLPELLNCNKLV